MRQLYSELLLPKEKSSEVIQMFDERELSRLEDVLQWVIEIPQ